MELGTREKGQGTREKGRAVAAIFCVLFLFATCVYAQQPPPSPPEGFVPAGDLVGREQLPAAPLVIGAYAVAWVAVFGYLWSIWQRIGRVEGELADVSRRLAAGERR